MDKFQYKVTTWANGYGVWQAEVTVPNMAAFGPVVMRAARKAIIAELVARDEPHENMGMHFIGILGDKVRYEECELAAR